MTAFWRYVQAGPGSPRIVLARHGGWRLEYVPDRAMDRKRGLMRYGWWVLRSSDGQEVDRRPTMKDPGAPPRGWANRRIREKFIERVE